MSLELARLDTAAADFASRLEALTLMADRTPVPVDAVASGK